jgi:hypothetical protein
MGLYLDIPEKTKKVGWLQRTYPQVVTTEKPVHNYRGDTVVVCVIFNPEFESALVCVDSETLDMTTNPRDKRKKVWLICPRFLVIDLCPACASRLPNLYVQPK